MKYDWIDAFLLSKNGVEKDFKTEGAVADELLKDMLDKSYRLVLSGFSKKKQNEILNPIS